METHSRTTSGRVSKKDRTPWMKKNAETIKVLRSMEESILPISKLTERVKALVEKKSETLAGDRAQIITECDNYYTKLVETNKVYSILNSKRIYVCSNLIGFRQALDKEIIDLTQEKHDTVDEDVSGSELSSLSDADSTEYDLDDFLK